MLMKDLPSASELSPSQRLVRDSRRAQRLERLEGARWPDLGPSAALAAMSRPPAALVGARKTLARFQEGETVADGLNRPASPPRPPDLGETARRLLNNPLNPAPSTIKEGRPALDWHPARAEGSESRMWAERDRETGFATARSDREPEKQQSEYDWWNHPDEEMIITADGYSSDHYHQGHDWGDRYDDRHHPYHGGRGGTQDDDEDNDERPEEQPEHSVALNGSDLSRQEQQACFVQRMGIWEEDVDWLAWWTTYSDSASLFRRPGPADTKWRIAVGQDPDGTGRDIIFTLCGGTIVFARIVSVEFGRHGTYRVEWYVWAYRSPDCTSEDLSHDWMVRTC